MTAKVMMDEWRQYAYNVGYARHRADRHLTDRSRAKHIRTYPQEENVIGAAGEVAVCLYLGHDPKKHVVAEQGPVPGADLILPCGSYQVKTPMRHLRPANVNWVKTGRHGKELGADYAALVWPGPRPYMTIVGFLSRDEYDAVVTWNERLPVPGWFVHHKHFHTLNRQTQLLP